MCLTLDLDRNNFSNARLYGLEDDLGLSDVEYQTCLSILLVGYVACQVPSNMVLNAITRPSWYLCGCVAIWGVISACTAATHNAAGAIACRFLLGCAESAFFPGSIYYLSRWYTRKEMQLRVTILNAGNILAQAFGGLIAAAVLKGLEGVAGIRAWRWLFILEGCITVLLALLSVFILPDYPKSTAWLSGQEKHVATSRLALDVGADDEHDIDDKLKGLREAVSDPKVWLLGFTYFLTIMGLSFSYFFPTITQALGFSTVTTLLLTAPPWIFALVIAVPNAWHADRTGERFLHYLWPAVVCLAGYIISIVTTRAGPRYFSCFLMTVGYSCGFTILAWISSTIPRPRAKRAAAIGIINAMGNIGNIPGSYIWASKYGPYYRKPFGANVAILGTGCVLALGLRQYLVRQNKKLDRLASVSDQGIEVKSGSDVKIRYLY